MMDQKLPSQTRLIFLDNLRYFFVISVVLLHAANSYSHGALWWPVVEKNTSLVADVICAFADTSAMLLLFFIAGFFAVPTIQKHGAGSFLKGKLTRLGIPWILSSLVICPVLPLVYHFTRDGMVLSMSYGDRWLSLMSHFTEFNVGVIRSMDAMMQNDQFFQRYMWFISLLLLFFALFAVAYRLRPSWFEKNENMDSTKEQRAMPVWKMILGFGCMTFVLSIILIRIMFLLSPGTRNPEAWFTLGNMIQFQPSRLAAYIAYFILGIIVYKNSWIARGKFSGRLTGWVISFVLLMIIYLAGVYFFLNTSGKQQMISGLVLFFSRNLLTVAILGLSLTFGYRFWNKPTKIDGVLATNSYNIYLSHYIFVIGFQLLLFLVPGIPALLKFAIVAASSLLCAYLASELLIRRHPKITVVMLFIVLAGMFVFIKP